MGNEIFIEFIGVSPRTFFFFRIFVPIHICYLLISQFTKFETISKRGDSRNRRYGAAAGNEKERMGRKKERGKEGRSAQTEATNVKIQQRREIGGKTTALVSHTLQSFFRFRPLFFLRKCHVNG